LASSKAASLRALMQRFVGTWRALKAATWRLSPFGGSSLGPAMDSHRGS